MRKQKSKSNIPIQDLKYPKPTTNLYINSNIKHSHHPDANQKPIPDTKKHKTTKDPKPNKALNTKSKNHIEKCSNPKTYDHHDPHPIFSIQRRNSASLISQRVPSRLSNKRTSVVSSKSNKFAQDTHSQEQHKENDQNKININQIQNHQQDCDFESIKNTKSKKKLSLNLNLNQYSGGETKKQCDGQKKGQKKQKENEKQKDKQKEKGKGKQKQKQKEKEKGKGRNVEMFERKWQNYLNEKKIFSEQFLEESKGCKKSKSKKSISSRNSRSKQKIQAENMKKMTGKIEAKDIGMEMYHKFYKKSFEMNLKNCLKYGSWYGSREERSKQSTVQKMEMKPCESSSTMGMVKDETMRLLDWKMELRERNESRCSNESGSNGNGNRGGSNGNRDGGKQRLGRSRRDELRLVWDKQNGGSSTMQMSSLLESRSGIVPMNNNNSSSSNYGSLANRNRNSNSHEVEDFSLKRSKQSYKNLILFNSTGNNNEISGSQNKQLAIRKEKELGNAKEKQLGMRKEKELDKGKEKELAMKKDKQNQRIMDNQSKLTQIIDIRRVSIGQSNIDVLKWSSSNTQQMQIQKSDDKLVLLLVDDENDKQQKKSIIQKKSGEILIPKPKLIYQQRKEEEQMGRKIQVEATNKKQSKQIKGQQNTSIQLSHSPKHQELIRINMNNKNTVEQLSSLADLSSISSIHQYDQCQIKPLSPNQNHIQEIPFDL